jgi:branched-chain amino acid transport system permease protein
LDIFFQQIINGLVIGSVYALVALGYTMVYGILGIINFAHGEVVMIGAMIALSIILFLFQFDIPIYLSLALVFFWSNNFLLFLGFLH